MPSTVGEKTVMTLAEPEAAEPLTGRGHGTLNPQCSMEELALQARWYDRVLAGIVCPLGAGSGCWEATALGGLTWSTTRAMVEWQLLGAAW